jgi:hypothetical protein
MMTAADVNDFVDVAAEGPGRGAPGAFRILPVDLQGSFAESGQVQDGCGVVRGVVEAGDGKHEVADCFAGSDAVEGDDAGRGTSST